MNVIANALSWLTRIWAVLCLIKGISGILVGAETFWDGPQVFAILDTYSVQSYLLVLASLWTLTVLFRPQTPAPGGK
jgi:hypothetical protein